MESAETTHAATTALLQTVLLSRSRRRFANNRAWISRSDRATRGHPELTRADGAELPRTRLLADLFPGETECVERGIDGAALLGGGQPDDLDVVIVCCGGTKGHGTRLQRERCTPMVD